ncbi:DUF6349 family protein [Nesterenkonia aurantiaca]|uniref:DUF6349 family protein n=1 Tax=Nesterenkonia aurantiaca TaxID=1436010 RepID=UPI003EE4700A
MSISAPLRFTTDYHPPDALREAYERWCEIHGRLASCQRSHMWHQIGGRQATTRLWGHRLDVMNAELRPYAGHHGPGVLLYQAICEFCEWHTFGSEAEVVEDWHDHAHPGWRDLPVMPLDIRSRTETAILDWIRDRYTIDMQVGGAPIVTERTAIGTRHVPGYSPFGGYDLSHTALTRPSRVQADTRPMQLALF